MVNIAERKVRKRDLRTLALPEANESGSDGGAREARWKNVSASGCSGDQCGQWMPTPCVSLYPCSRIASQDPESWHRPHSTRGSMFRGLPIGPSGSNAP
jgi:hypothetical protein